jgi:hypothetical protein
MTRLWLISCDRCGQESEPGRHKLEVMARARADGWRLAGGGWEASRDLCPDCATRPQGRPA